MADLGLPIPTLSDVLSSILSPIDGPPDSQSVSISVVTVPVQVTVTATVSDTPPTSTTAPPTTSTTSHATSTSSSTVLSLSNSNSNSTNTGDFITTTYLTSQGTAVFTVTAVVSNPAGHVHNDQANTPNAFFNNRTAVIGVFTVVGIIGFAIIAALIAWGARRRTIKRLKKEEAEKNSRDFFEDEVNDAGAPSEKSWWGNASGASIPEGAVPLQVVTSYNNAPPMPPFPPEFSPSTGAPASLASKSPLLDGGLMLPHPYASTAGSFSPELYSNNSTAHDRNLTTNGGWVSPTRDASRSPPPNTPLPSLPYRSPHSNNPAYLPLIHEGGSEPLSTSVGNHPFSSPPTNRRSELFPEDVLWGFGNAGGVGRSLSGKRPEAPVQLTQTHGAPLSPPNRPPMPALPPPPQQSILLQQPQYLLYPADAQHEKRSPVESSRTSPNHSSTNVSNARIRPTSGISEGGWYDDSNSEVGRAPLAGATASGESFLNGAMGTNERYGYPYTAPGTGGSRSQVDVGRDKSAATSAAELPERKKVPHDPRFSGLFGNVVPGSREESRQSHGRLSEDFDIESVIEDHHTNHSHGGSGNRVLRVTNE